MHIAFINMIIRILKKKGRINIYLQEKANIIHQHGLDRNFYLKCNKYSLLESIFKYRENYRLFKFRDKERTMPMSIIEWM